MRTGRGSRPLVLHTTRIGASARIGGQSFDLAGKTTADAFGDDLIGTDGRWKRRAARGSPHAEIQATKAWPLACHHERSDLPGGTHYETRKQRHALIETGGVHSPEQGCGNGVGRKETDVAVPQPVEVPSQTTLRSGPDGDFRLRMSLLQSPRDGLSTRPADILIPKKSTVARVRRENETFASQRESGMTAIQQ
jgi:hypothetical protein